MNQKQLLNFGKAKLESLGIEEAYYKCKILLKYLLNQTNEQFVVRSLENVSEEIENLFETKLQEIISGKPIQYITNKQAFMGLEFYVDENVLIPQPDTEILVEKAIEQIVLKQKSEKELIKPKVKTQEKNEVSNKAQEKNQVSNKTYEEEKNQVSNKPHEKQKILDLCTGKIRQIRK